MKSKCLLFSLIYVIMLWAMGCQKNDMQDPTPTPTPSAIPAKLWDKTYGSSRLGKVNSGSNQSNLTDMIATADGGYLLGGDSFADAADDKSADNQGNTDFWVVKVDPNGNKQWDKNFGGVALENLGALVPTRDGGYLLVGQSGSNAEGGKTETAKKDSSMWIDIWIVKIDAGGKKLWDKSLGAAATINGVSAVVTADGGFLVGANYATPRQAPTDLWLFRLDASGNKLWEKTLGGSGIDHLSTVATTANGEYLVGGYSNSNIGRDKSENSQGGFDMWVVRLDASGNKRWDKTLGGSAEDEGYALQEMADGSVLVFGDSASPADGNKSAPNKGGADLWLVKLNASGDKIWDKTYGGTDLDYATSALLVSKDGSLLLGGYSYSPLSGDKSQGVYPGKPYAGYDEWFIKVDASGSKLWDKTFGGTDGDYPAKALLTSDGGFLLGGTSFSPTSADKDATNKGVSDYWLIKIK